MRKRKPHVNKALQAEWEAMMKKHSKPLEMAKGVKRKPVETELTELKFQHHRETTKIESRASNSGSTAKRESMQYTGDKMLGVTVLHKSCLQPIFNSDAAIDAAHMRR